MHRASRLPSPRPIGRPAALGLSAAGLALLGAAAVLLISPLNGNLRYEAGVKDVGSFSAAGTFSHRPLAFRLLAEAVFEAAAALSAGTVAFEFAVRLLFLVLAAGCGLLLWRGLLAHGVRDAGLHAAVVVGATVLLTPISVGEPDWVAAPLSGAGAGLALLGRRRSWAWALAGGAALVVAADLKIFTAATAALGLTAVALVDRRQALRTAVAGAAAGAALVVATAIWVPHEIQWLLDLRTVQKDAVAALPDSWAYFADLTAGHLVLALLPAAWVLAPPRERVVIAFGTSVAVASVVVQGQYFVYHAAGLVTVATLAVFRSLRGRVSVLLGTGVAVLVALACVVTAVPRAWMADHQKLSGAAVVALTLLALGSALAVRHRPRTARVVPAAVAALALLLPASTPWAGHLLRAGAPEGAAAAGVLRERDSDEAVAAAVRRVVGGPAVPVTYLTFGEWTYFVGNPTDCRYPSPLFLQRSTPVSRGQTATRSYRENLACLSAPGSRWLVWDPAWMPVGRRPAELRAAVARSWDCAAALQAGPLRLCPRRR